MRRPRPPRGCRANWKKKDIGLPQHPSVRADSRTRQAKWITVTAKYVCACVCISVWSKEVGKCKNGGYVPGIVKRFLSSLVRPSWPWDQSSYLLNGYQNNFLRVKRPRNESPPSSAEVKNERSCTHTQQSCALMALMRKKICSCYKLLIFIVSKKKDTNRDAFPKLRINCSRCFWASALCGSSV
jgi:hypothetical protein